MFLFPIQQSSILGIKATFSLAFIHALILLLGSFLQLVRFSAVSHKKRLHSLQNLKKQVVWKIHVPLPCFIIFMNSWKIWCKWHLVNGLKTLASQKAVCPLIQNPLADISALAWLLIFEDLGHSSPVNGVSNDSITTFLQTSLRISPVRILKSLCLVISSPFFWKDKVCCKLNKSLQTYSVGKCSRGILYLICIACKKACFSRKIYFSLLVSLLTK